LLIAVKDRCDDQFHRGGMTRHLVAYYSWTGNTKRVAKAVADRLGAEIEEIVELRPYQGPFGRFLNAVNSIIRRKPPIAQVRHEIGRYDVVVLGSPVWAADMAAPMRSFLVREKGKITRAAFFCTQGGLGGKTALENMARLSGAEPLSILLLDDEQLRGSGWKASVDSFVQSIGTAASLRQHSGLAGRTSREEGVQDRARADQNEKVGDAPL
jgi:flavodoxin